MDARKAAGFTLIEIAIVLVVIGLLVGAVLTGQELIASARVRNLSRIRTPGSDPRISRSSIAIAGSPATGTRTKPAKRSA